MAVSALVARAAAGIIRPVNILVSSAFQSCSNSVRLVSTLSGRPFGHIQTPLVSPAASLVPPVRSLACGHPSAILNSVTPLLPTILRPQVRTVTYCSLRKGKRKSVKAVLFRFLRLHCGLWVRKKAGYKKRLWKKKPARKRRLREQVFCNKTQSKLLDKMTTSFWKRRNWYIDDPFQKYHDRTNLKV
ncbi:39S ribosomal protein L35, mitochondrial [Trichosurus vulpecula]|uniref:39S ribosomal protein L35, mitochondrial n=1 Tax=Trichosurus vulpecula TaxID=9337 RepID=UPI00186B40CA|nr:39S ribosomal protein L35, mitochondrial [Trichosurus vulpecula]